VEETIGKKVAAGPKRSATVVIRPRWCVVICITLLKISNVDLHVSVMAHQLNLTSRYTADFAILRKFTVSHRLKCIVAVQGAPKKVTP